MPAFLLLILSYVMVGFLGVTLKTSLSIRSFLFVFLFLVQTLFAAPPAVRKEHSLDLSAFEGQTFLQTMEEEETGIKAHFDSDYLFEYEVAEWTTIQKALSHFDTKVRNKVLKAFEKREAGLQKLIVALEGTTFSPSNIVPLVGKEDAWKTGKSKNVRDANIFEVSQFIAMASGASTLVKINSKNYYYNYGYKSGAHKDDVKSGRSFGAGPNHAANDASDIMYLNELEEHLNETKAPKAFYQTFLEVLTQTKTSGFNSRKLSALGQTVLTDLLAIYTAESNRHIMVNLNPKKHPWENDLAEVTLLSAYCAASGKVLREDSFRDGNLVEWWAKSSYVNPKTGKKSNRSGIGITRVDRRKLQRAVAGCQRQSAPELVEAVETLVGGSGVGGDVYRGVMEYLNARKNQKEIVANAKEITSAVVDLVLDTRENASALTECVETKLAPAK